MKTNLYVLPPLYAKQTICIPLRIYVTINLTLIEYHPMNTNDHLQVAASRRLMPRSETYQNFQEKTKLTEELFAVQQTDHFTI